MDPETQVLVSPALWSPPALALNCAILKDFLLQFYSRFLNNYLLSCFALSFGP